ncbi:MAG: zinc ribbon domain-containing protein [Chloroflexi bacterium]|nr:zinc ribbon domain-containing protein [Chloroflexota bacterium]
MPLYEYECPTCGNRFELFRPVTDQRTEVCPQCGSSARRRIAPAGIIFKGSGFYKTDYGSSSGGSPPKDGEGETKTPKDKTTKEKTASKADED